MDKAAKLRLVNIMSKENLQARYYAVLITVVDLRRDLQAQALGLQTDLTAEETRGHLARYVQKLADLKAAIQSET